MNTRVMTCSVRRRSFSSSLIFLSFSLRNDGFRCYPCSHGRPIPPFEDQHRYAVLRSSRGLHTQICLPGQSLVWGVHAREARANLFVFRSRAVLRLFVHLHAPFCQRLCRRLEGICIVSLGVNHVLKLACRSQAEARIWSPGG